MSRPLVSVLIPCHNAQKYIGQTLESVFRQTWPNIEVIVVDDGSEDASVREIERFTRLRLIKRENLGAGAARNKAYGASSGGFVQFLDADDLIEPEKIQRQMVRLAGHPRSVASAEWGRFYETPLQTLFQPESNWRDLEPKDWLALSRA